MTPKERAAMQQALEALENERAHMTANWDNIVKAITALREALAEPELNLNCKSVQKRLATLWGYVKAEQVEQEPVAWFVQYKNRHEFVFGSKPEFIVDGVVEPLYAHPVRTKDLTDDELQPFIDEWWNLPCDTAHDVKKIFRAVIAAYKEKNK